MYRNLKAFLMLAVCSMPVLSGQLLVGKVVEVANTSNNTKDFVLRLSDSSGVCSGVTWIRFPEAKKQSDDSYKQAFSIALTALSTGDNVRIHNFEDDSCDGANFISIFK